MANSASDARHSEADIRRRLIEENLIYAMITLPSNMFYTVTLPATLWFFDKAKTDDRILFIDARNIFIQIDRAHREFSAAQIQNISIISHLRKGHREKFIQLVDNYFTDGMKKLLETRSEVTPIAEELKKILDDADGVAAIADFVQRWKEVQSLHKSYEKYLSTGSSEKDIAKKNKAQNQLRENFDPFFERLHDDLKTLDKIVRKAEKVSAGEPKSNGPRGSSDRQMKNVKTKLADLHGEEKKAEEYFKHITWLQERFPNAEYEDVTGLCKLATIAEVKEQDYSLNPGRYVGVVIEEDGKTEEEFIQILSSLHDDFINFSSRANELNKTITTNFKRILEQI